MSTPTVTPQPKPGALYRAWCWLFGENWKTTALGIIGGLAKVLPGLSVLNVLVPPSFNQHWVPILAWCLFIGGVCTFLSGIFAKDRGQ